MNAPSTDDPNLQIAQVLHIGDAVKDEELDESAGGLWMPDDEPGEELPPLRFTRRAATA